MPKNFTVKECAGIFRCSSRTIYRWISKGEIFNNIIKVKDGYLIPKEEIDRLSFNEIKGDDE